MLRAQKKVMCGNRIPGIRARVRPLGQIPRICARVRPLGQIPRICARVDPLGLIPRICAQVRSLGKIPSSAPEPLLGRISSLSNQFSSPCWVGSIPELLLGRISSRSDQFPSPCSVRPIPEPRLDRINSRIRSPASSSPELRSVRSVPEPPLGTSPTGGKNDMADVNLVATSSCPRTTGPSTWSTRRGKSVWRRYGGVSGRTADLAQVRSTPLTCRRTSHCKDDRCGGEVRRHGKQ
ncbi:hypothetical protein BHM03_00039252 [Ensete ventricosum]|nr:hypothetical protein BHM03_00039252 [Ensete ventricosum]